MGLAFVFFSFAKPQAKTPLGLRLHPETPHFENISVSRGTTCIYFQAVPRRLITVMVCLPPLPATEVRMRERRCGRNRKVIRISSTLYALAFLRITKSNTEHNLFYLWATDCRVGAGACAVNLTLPLILLSVFLSRGHSRSLLPMRKLRHREAVSRPSTDPGCMGEL